MPGVVIIAQQNFFRPPPARAGQMVRGTASASAIIAAAALAARARLSATAQIGVMSMSTATTDTKRTATAEQSIRLLGSATSGHARLSAGAAVRR